MKASNYKSRARGLVPLALAGLLVLLAAVGAAGSFLLANIEHPGTFAAGTPAASSDPKIYVYGNGDLAAAADSGSGTPQDPYIIENRNIDAGGSGSAIRIINTDAHFVIRNCTATGAGDYLSGHDAGILLINVQNANISGNTVSASGNRGIYLRESSDNNTVSGNTVWNIRFTGIDVHQSSNNNVTGNTVSACRSRGINVYGSNNNVSGNTVIMYMIILGTSTCTSETWDGHHGRNTFTDNTCVAPDVIALISILVTAAALILVIGTLRKRAVKKRERVAKEKRVEQVKQRAAEARGQFVAEHNALVEAARNAEQSGDVLAAVQRYSEVHQLISGSTFKSEFQPALEAAASNVGRLKDIIRAELEVQAASAGHLAEEGKYDEVQRQLLPIIDRAREAGLDDYAAHVQARMDQAMMLGKLASMFKASKRLKIDDVATIMKKDRADLMDLLFTWSEKFGFKIDGDFIVIGDDTDFDSFMSGLDKQFASWGDSESSKHGKI